MSAVFVRQCKRSSRGFTLIELVITVAIVGILSAIAVPMYSEYTVRARRADAMQALMSAAAAMERFKAANNFSYTDACMVGQGCVNEIFSRDVPSNGGVVTHNITVLVAADGFTYQLTATPVGAFANRDGALTLTNNGAKEWTDKDGLLRTCWPTSGGTC